MSPDSNQESSHPDELLPWFVNGTLSPGKQHEVEDHLNNCPRCQKEITFLENIREEIKTTSLESPGELGLQRLLAEIKNETTQPQKLTQPQQWWKTLAIAASLIIVVQAGLLMDAWYFSKPMMPLTGPQREGIVLQVSFVPTATEGAIRENLNAIHGTVIDGPGPLGIYRVRLNLQSANKAGIEKAIEFLRHKTTVIRHVAQE